MLLGIENWTEVTIGTLFNIYTGKDLIISKIKEGDIPVITHSTNNNGVTAYSSEIENRKLFNCKKSISLGDRGAFFAAIQKNDFYIGTRVKALEFKDGEHSENILKFFVTLINNESYRFCYGRNCTNGLEKLRINVPTKYDGTVDYDFIESYMQKFDEDIISIPDYFLDEGYKKACWYMDNINQYEFENKYAGCKEKNKINLNERDWMEFHLYELFEIDSGNRFDKSKMTSFLPTVNFIGRSSEKNGVTACVDEIEGVTPYKEGFLTIALGGEYIGSCFIQDHPFYTSQNVEVLKPKEPMSIYSKLFIAHLIRYESENSYKAFARELNAHTKTDFVIKLPIKSDNKPDFEFMDKYIKSLSFSCNIEKKEELIYAY